MIGGHDAIEIAIAGIAAVDEQRLSARRYPQRRLTTLSVDHINIERFCQSCHAAPRARPWDEKTERAIAASRFMSISNAVVCRPRYFNAEKSVGSANTDSTFVVSGPSFSDSALAFTQSGSARNAAQLFVAASRLSCDST